MATQAQAEVRRNIRMRFAEEHVLVRAFVSMVRRTRRNATKLENRPPSERARVSYKIISQAFQKIQREGRRNNIRVTSLRW